MQEVSDCQASPVSQGKAELASSEAQCAGAEGLLSVEGVDLEPDLFQDDAGVCFWNPSLDEFSHHLRKVDRADERSGQDILDGFAAGLLIEERQ
jgi:hypothetical protein